MIYELRIYRAAPDKMGALLARFRDDTCRIFERHGIKNVGYWTNTVGGRSDELWYMVAFEDHGQREQAWAAFRDDPEWAEVRARTSKDGPLVLHFRNQIMSPTNFSPLK